MRTVDAAGLAIGGDAPPRIMGVVNVSPESPYDPSVHTESDQAAAYVDSMIDDGADIVDVGLATANKRFEPLTATDELERLDLAADTISSVSGDAVFSIETRYHEVAAAAIDRGFELVNDVCGFADPDLPVVCADHEIAVVKMASPPDLERPGAIASVEEIHEAIQRGGFTDKTIIDPAFGGWTDEKTLEDDRDTFRRLVEFWAYDRPILVSINRKNFLRDLADRSTEDALPVSLAATSLAVERGASIIRTHDVGPTRDAAIIGHELGHSPVDGYVAGHRVSELETGQLLALQRQLTEAGIDAARATDWAWRAFAISNLEVDEWTVETLESAGVTVVQGDRLIIVGSIRSLMRLGSLATQLPEPVADVVSEIATTVYHR